MIRITINRKIRTNLLVIEIRKKETKIKAMMKTRDQIAVLLMSLIGVVLTQSCKCRAFHGRVVRYWPNLATFDQFWLHLDDFNLFGHFWSFFRDVFGFKSLDLVVSRPFPIDFDGFRSTLSVFEYFWAIFRLIRAFPAYSGHFLA